MPIKIANKKIIHAWRSVVNGLKEFLRSYPPFKKKDSWQFFCHKNVIMGQVERIKPFFFMIPFLRRTSYECQSDMTYHCWYGQHRNFAHTHKKNLLRNFKSLKRKKIMKRRRRTCTTIRIYLFAMLLFGICHLLNRNDPDRRISRDRAGSDIRTSVPSAGSLDGPPPQQTIQLKR